jgi:ATP-dependent Clp protease ATP-binding subunit ClpX
VKNKTPTPEEVQREISDHLKKIYGSGIQDVKLLFPDPETADDNKESKTTQDKKFKLEFNLKPKEVKAYLDKYVIKQEEAKKTLSIAICDHYNHVSDCAKSEKLQNDPKIHNEYEEEYSKQNVLLIGPTGVGKTYLIKTLAKLIGVPFVKADATKFSETGYVGGNVEDIIRDLVSEADGNVELAKYGMVFIDEIDKIASASNLMGKDVSGRGVQTGLLKLMEETEVDLNTPYDPISQMQALMEFQKKGKVEKRIINTKHILFFVSGAFNQLEEIIKERLLEQRIGFGAKVGSKKQNVDYMKECRSDDLVKFGFEPEFVGRLPVRVVCHELSVDDLYNITKHSEGSIIKQYKRAFKAYGIDVAFLDESLYQISERAYEEKTGARALSTVCEKVFRDYKFELPSSNIKSFVVTENMIKDPVAELEKLLSDPRENKKIIAEEQIRDYERDYAEKYKITIRFSDEAIGLISDKAVMEGINVKTICDKLLEDYEYGLNLIKRNTGKSEFIITPDVVTDPNGTLDKWVKQYYTANANNTVSENP